MKKKLFTKISTVILASQLAVTSIPLQAFAEEVGNTEQKAGDESKPETEIKAETGTEAVVETKPEVEATGETEATDETEAPEETVIEDNKVENEAPILDEDISIPNQDLELPIIGRATTPFNIATVSTWAEFRAALLNDSITEINLAANITMTQNVLSYGLNKTIHGNGYKISSNLYQIRLMSAFARATMENVEIINTDDYGLFWSSLDVVVTYKDVVHEGRQMIYLPAGELKLEGKVTSLAATAEVFQGKILTVLDNADVNFESLTASAGVSPIELGANGSLTVGKNAKLNVLSNSISIGGGANVSIVNNGSMNLLSRLRSVILISTGSTVELNNGSTFKGVSNDTVQDAIEATGGSLYVRSGATFEVESTGTHGTIVTGTNGSLVFEKGSNFSVTNYNSDGAVFASYPGSTNVTINSTQGVQAWNRGVVNAVVPTYSFAGPLQATFRLTGYLQSVTQANMWSDNQYFQNQFKTGGTGKITGGTFASVDIKATTINALTTDSVTASGTGEPNARVEVKANGTVIGSGIVDSAGNYSLTIPKQTEGTTVNAQATLGNLTSNIASTVVTRTSISETTIHELNTNSTVVTGNAEPNATVDIKVGSNVIASGRVGSDGFYSVGISKQANGTQVTAQATLNGVASNIASTTVTRAGIDATTIQALTNISTVATGTAEANATITIKVGANEIASGKVGSDGRYSVTIPKQTTGTTVLAEATLDGVSSNIASTVVVGIPQGTITPSTYTVGTSNITGTFTGDVVRANLIVNGRSISTGGTFAAGDFSYFVNSSLIKAGDVVVLVALDANNNELDRETVAVEGITQGTITPNKYRVGTSNITGTYTGDVARANLIVNGRSISWGGNFANGNFSYFVNSGLIKAGDTVVLVAFDAKDKELDRKTVPVEALTQGTITPNAYQLGTSNITGSYTGDVARANLLVNGVSQSWGGNFANGNFSYFVNPSLIKAGDTVVLVALDAQGKELDRKAVSISALQGTIAPNAYTLGSSNITGNFTGDVNFGRLFVNGVHAGWGGTFNSNGTFSFFVNQNLIKAGDIVRIEAMHRLPSGETTILDTKQVNIGALAGTITPSDYTLGSSNITGAFTGDVNVARLFINNQPQSWGGSFNSDGTFSFFVNQNLIKAGDIVRIEAMHRLSTGETTLLDTKQVTVVSALAGTIAPDAYTLGESTITGTVTGDVNFGRLFINGQHALWGGTYNPDGTFSFYVGRDLIKAGDTVVIEGLYRAATSTTTVLDTQQLSVLTNN
ncbi:immunoglobulin-like domain-containing protein [Vagococcus sp.]|uniref:immunoglobulin-like domain-containing protein n=1 Tax=Vagococcus sp. TaxID=1933889 RepID=UPI002FC76EA0